MKGLATLTKYVDPGSFSNGTEPTCTCTLLVLAIFKWLRISKSDIKTYFSPLKISTQVFSAITETCIGKDMYLKTSQLQELVDIYMYTEKARVRERKREGGRERQRERHRE